MKNQVLAIRCSKSTKLRFKFYATIYPSYEEALNRLLDLAGVPPYEQLPHPVGPYRKPSFL